MKSDNFFMRFEKESNLKARELLTKAIKLDPKFARAIAFVGFTYMNETRYGWAHNPADSLRQAEELANRALDIDDNVYLTYALLSRIYSYNGLHEQAIATGKRGLEVEPGNATAILALGWTMIYAGEPKEALMLVRKAMRSCPHPPLYLLVVAVYANYLTGHSIL